MTTPNHDDDAIRDPRFDAAWRAASRAEPPPELDAAIRAAARREVGAGPQGEVPSVPEATRPERWWWPLAAAATIGAIAIGVLQLVPQDGDVADSTRVIISDMPAGAAANGAATKGKDAALVTRTPQDDAGTRARSVVPAPAAATESRVASSTPATASAPAARADKAAQSSAPVAAPPVSPPPPAAAGAAPASVPSAVSAPPRATPAIPPSSALPIPAAAPPSPPSIATAPRAPRPFPAESGEPEAAAAAPPSAAMAAPSAADAARRDAFAPPDVPTQPEPAAVQPKRAGVASGGIAPPQRAAPLREDRTAESARQAPDTAIGTRAGATRAAAPAALAPRTATGRAPVAAGASAERFADPAVEAKAKERAPLSVTDWIALIRKLVADRRNDDAVLELKAFRLAHPDADTLLPPELRDWPPGAR